MARNYRRQESVVAYTRKRLWQSRPSCKPEFDTVQTFTQNLLVLEEARDDVHVGNGVESLPYWAYKIACRPNDLSIRRDAGDASYYCSPSEQGRSLRPYVCTGKTIPSPFITSCLGVSKASVQPYWRPSVDANVKARARNSLNRKIKRGEAELGTTLAEMHELKGMMVQPLVTLVKLFYDVMFNKSKVPDDLAELLKGQRRRQKQLAKQRDISNVYAAFLSIELGWKPLMNEIFGLQQALLNLTKEEPMYVRFKSSATGGQVIYPVPAHHTVSGDFTQEFRCEVLGYVAPSFRQGLQRLGLTNPAAIAWELVPSSFIFDWFVKVGDFLEALEKPVGFDFISGHETAYTSADCLVTRTDFTPGGGEWTGQHPSWTYKSYAMVRELTLALPLPQLVIGDGINTPWRAAITAAIYSTSANGRIRRPNYSPYTGSSKKVSRKSKREHSADFGVRPYSTLRR